MFEIIRKHEFIIHKCSCKKVLDLGCIDHDLYDEKIITNNWLHKKIQGVASSVIGVDLLEEMVVRLNKKGFNIVKGDVEELSSVNELKNKKFDIIVAGDLIEHLFNPGRFLEGMKPFFHENTELILTTPNCFSTSYMLPYIFSGFEIVREDHTCWYSEKTLKQLILMSGYAVKEFHYRSEKIINGIRPFFRVSLRKLFPRFCEGLILVGKLRQNDKS